MSSPIDRLKKFKERILSATVFDRTFAEFVAIEVLDFISKDNPEIAAIFNSRLNYLKNLAEDKNFSRLQDEKFESIQPILNLATKEDVEELQKEYRNATWSRFKNGSDHLTLPQLYEQAKNKENFYRLGDQCPYSPLDGEISIDTPVLPIKKQFEPIERLLQGILVHTEQKNPALKETTQKLAEAYNAVSTKLDELIYKMPKKLHFEHFEQFVIFCAKAYPVTGREFLHDFFKHNFYNGNQAKELNNIKEHAIIVLDDLVEELGRHPLKTDGTRPLPVGAKLKFYPDDGTAEYRGVSARLKTGTKGGELLKFFYQNKNSPLELRYIQTGCNDGIRIMKHRFKTEKDVEDTIRTIRRKLKVKKSEYFPLYKTGNSFILEER